MIFCIRSKREPQVPGTAGSSSVRVVMDGRTCAVKLNAFEIVLLAQQLASDGVQ